MVEKQGVIGYNLAMIINWYGEGCFRIQSGESDILIDPFDSKTGLTPPRFKQTLTLKTLTASDFLREEEEGMVIMGGGDYEVSGIEIKGLQIIKSIPTSKESGPRSEGVGADKFVKTIYVLNLEGISIGVLGHLSELPEADVEGFFAGLNILMIPLGGKPFLEVADATKLIKTLEPQIIIPTFFKVPGLKREALDSKDFVKALGLNSETEEKLVVKKKDFSEMKPKIVTLKT